jgi:hypothetical protein
VDRILAKVNEYGVVQNTFNVDILTTREKILEVLDLLHGGLSDIMVNITIICHMDCVGRVLKEV